MARPEQYSTHSRSQHSTCYRFAGVARATAVQGSSAKASIPRITEVQKQKELNLRCKLAHDEVIWPTDSCWVWNQSMKAAQDSCHVLLSLIAFQSQRKVFRGFNQNRLLDWLYLIFLNSFLYVCKAVGFSLTLQRLAQTSNSLLAPRDSTHKQARLKHFFSQHETEKNQFTYSCVIKKSYEIYFKKIEEMVTSLA